MRSSFNLVLAAAVVASSSAAVLAAPTAWTTPAGDRGNYTYANGQSLNGRFGPGETYSEGFYTLPANFTAIAHGAAPSTSLGDTLSVILNAKPNQMFSHISSGLLGDFSIFGSGDVNATGTLRVTNLDTASTLTAPLAFGGTVPKSTTTFEQGVFAGTGAITLPSGWTNIRVELDGALTANSQGGTSHIQFKDGELSIDTAQIPIPAAFAVAPIAAYIGYRARRKIIR